MIPVYKGALERLRNGIGPASVQLPGLIKSLAPLLLFAVGVTALVMVFLWREQAQYKPLFGAREKVPVTDMLAVLDDERIPYRLHPDSGQVLVPGDKLGAARMLLASKGVVAKLPAGLELTDRNDPLGVSQFVQDVRFRRGLEGELAQSIMTLDAVESARVHLAIARSSSFVLNDAGQSSASVVVELKPGRRLNSEQIAAIVHMVAGSVSGLDPQRVSLVDQAGNFLSARVNLDEGFESGQGGEAARRYQDEIRRNVHELLAQALGMDNYKVGVTVEVDTDRIEETREQYGEAPRLTNEAMREEVDQGRAALGVPGSLSNRPVQDPGTDENIAGSSTQRSATTRQYAYDRSITQIKRSNGRLSRVNVAVVLNAAAAPNGTGTWTPEELANIESILRNGLGIDAERGDRLVVSSLPFPPQPAPTPWWMQRDTIVDMASWAKDALIVILAYFLVLRPLIRIVQRRFMAAPSSDLAQAQPVLERSTGPALPASGAAGRPAVPLLESGDLPQAGSPVDVMVDHLRALAAKEPERVAEVVKQWVQSHG